MRLIFDDAEITLTEATLEKVLQEVALLTRQANEGGRVVAHILVDGQDVADLEAFLRGRVYPPPEVIKITTLTPTALVNEAISTALTFLPSLHEDILQKAAKLIQGQNIGGDSWGRFLEGLDWLNSLLAAVLQHYHLTEPKKKEVSFLAEELRQSLREMAAAWEQGDVVGLADALEYRLAPLIDDYLAFFTSLSIVGGSASDSSSQPDLSQKRPPVTKV
ncbi:hypothetical protein [Neomoorella humiferrea]|uniref:hypothetical protein n=1 Tax=Neomoorella humiferrea TaxID=676965 RepID=UPI0030CE97A4